MFHGICVVCCFVLVRQLCGGMSSRRLGSIVFWIVSLSCVGENIRHTSARCADIGGVTCTVAESRAEMVHDVVMRWMSTVFN